MLSARAHGLCTLHAKYVVLGAYVSGMVCSSGTNSCMLLAIDQRTAAGNVAVVNLRNSSDVAPHTNATDTLHARSALNMIVGDNSQLD